ncbi:hypothetical protein [Azospirillum sp. ST 5-10]|uniref:hypothetical protein n=1 Tax=unclassified Azospirillum TaxID=2630922 RepID=UPI003F4A6D34
MSASSATATAGTVPLASPSAVPRWSGWAILAAALALSYARAPWLFAHPRLVAEDGWFLSRAAEIDGLGTLLMLHYRGYFQLFNNLVAFLSFELAQADLPEAVPYLMEGAALLVHLLPVAIIAFAGASYARPPAVRAAMALGVLVVLPQNEVWLTPMMSHFPLGLAAFLVLLDRDRPGRGKALAYNGVLAFAVLTGPPAALLAPAFVVKALLDRRRDVIVNAAVVVAGLAAQMLAMKLSGSAVVQPAAVPLADKLLLVPAALFFKSVLTPTLGYAMANDVLSALTGALGPRGAAAVAAAAMAALVLALGRLFGWRAHGTTILLTGLAAGVVAAAAIVSAPVDPTVYLPSFNASRYFYQTSAMLLCALTAMAAPRLRDALPAGRRAVAAACAVAVGLPLLTGLWHLGTGIARSGPDWAAQVAAWRAGTGTCCVSVWPGAEWYAIFLPDYRSCVEGRLDLHGLGAGDGGTMAERLARLRARYGIQSWDRVQLHNHLCLTPQPK